MTSIQDVESGFAGRQQEFDPRVYLDILRRRYIYLIVPAVVVAAVVFWISRVLPPVFEARATILVESQQIPTALAQSTVSTNAAERIQLIQQRLLARDNLLEIARKFNLYAGAGLSPSEVVEAMRGAARIQQIDVGRTARPDTQAIGFTVGFQYRDASAAANVASEFVTSILQQNIQSRTTRAAETKKFFEQRVAQLEKDLAELEARTVEFKKANEDALPETLASRRTLLLQYQSSIADIDRKVAFANDPKLLEPEKAKLESLNRQLTAKKQQLQFQEEELESLKQLLDKGVVPKNRVRDAERAIDALKVDISAVEDDVANASSDRERTFMLDQLKQDRADLERKIADLNASIAKTPVIEAQLIALTRAYDNMQQEYRDAKAKASEAAVGEQLEEDRQAERFEVIEQATVPSEPISPNRKRIASMGVLGGLAAGAGLMMLLEFLDKSIRSAADLERRLSIRPLATIPYMVLASERSRRRWLAITIVVVGLAAIVVALMLIQTFYMPLDLFFGKLTQKLGL